MATLKRQKNTSSFTGDASKKRYSQSKLYSYQYQNRSALDILNEYQKRIQNQEWLSSDDRAKYKSAIDDYISSGSALREASKFYGTKYTADEEASWNNSLASLTSSYDEVDKYYSQWRDEDAYRGVEHWLERPSQFDDGCQVGDVTKAIGGTLSDIGTKLGSGLLGIGEAFVDAMATMGYYYNQSQGGGGWGLRAQQAHQQAMATQKKGVEEFVAQDLYDEDAIARMLPDALEPITGINIDQHSVLGGKVDSVVKSSGQMLGAIGLQGLGVPWWMTIGTTAFGGESENAVRQGASLDEAAFSGLVSAGSEILTERLFDGIKLIGGNTLSDTVLKPFINSISNKTIRRLASEGINILGEGAEEWLSGALSAVGQKLSYASEQEWKNLFSSEDATDAFIGGVLMSIGLGGASAKVSDAIVNTRQGADMQKAFGKGVGAELTAQTLELNGDNKYAQKLNSKLEGGKNLSAYQTGKILGEYNTEVNKADVGKIKAAAEARLTELGETGNVSAIADVIARQAAGEEISLKDKKILKESRAIEDRREGKVVRTSTIAERVANELNRDNIESGRYSSAWAEGIGTKRVNADVYNLRRAMVDENTASRASENAAPKRMAMRTNEIDDNSKLIEAAARDKIGRIEGFTEETASAMVKGYDGRVSASEYITAFDEAMELGKRGASSREVTKLSENTGIGSALLVAYDAGLQARENVALEATNTENSVLQNTTERGIMNTESEIIDNEGKTATEGIRLRDGGERLGGTNPEGQIRGLEGGAGQNQEWREGRGRPADGEAARLLDEGRGREVRVADLGILNGSKNQKVRVIENEADFTPSMKEAAKKAKEQGLIAKFIAGDNILMEAKDGSLYEANGYILGNIVLIRADHADFTSDQLMTHEVTHDKLAKVGAVRKSQIIAAARQKITEIADTPEAVNQLSASYADAYRGSQLTDEEVWEEIICDIEAGMNRFSGDRKYLMDYAIRDTKGYAGQMISESVVQNNGGVTDGRASREKAKYIPYSKIGANNISHITNELKKLYGDMESGIADEIAVEANDEVYIVHSGKENGRINFGVTKIIHISDEQGRKEFIRRANNDAVSKDRVSDGLFAKLKSGDANNRGSNLRRESGSELQVDTGKPEDQQGRVSGEDADQRGITEFKSAEEAKTSGRVSDARFSIEFADDIAGKQRKYEADGLSMISSAELEQAISDTARMVEEMKPYANILPQDKVGKTLAKNGSYDVSVENTTVCIRTLAYNSFVDMVSEKVGRPLTQMESFLVSQKLYEIAKEPQCLYCYVSLDRKAFNEMVIRYTEQRDAAIEAYEAAGKPKIPSKFDAEWSLFKQFLDGRKPTKNMWDRYVGWLNAYNKGERLVSLADISTEAKRLELVEAGGEMASQVKDMLKYAQSASWAKKQTQYVAYYDEILKLKPAVIRNLNSHYGMRWYSFSDYSGAFIVENMQQITDAAIRGLKGLSYTKDTDFAEIFAPTGMNINISVYAKKGENGYEIDAKQSANIDEAIKLRNQYPNVGIVVVATDAKGVEWALEQEWSDVVIPFHTVRTGADVAEFYNWEIFNAEQSDTVADQNLWDAYVNSVGKKKASKMVYPSEHQNNKDTYLRIINERGLKPRFSSFLDNPNYMKLVNETRQSEGQTQPLKPNYNLDAALRSFDKFVEKGGYYEGWYNDGIDVDNEADIVASDVRAGKKVNEVDYGRQDIDFEAVKAGRKDNRVHGRASIEFDPDIYETVAETDEDVKTRKFLENARTNRGLLANALETVAQNEAERENLKQYKDRVDMLNRESFKLSKINEEIKELTFGKGEKNPARLKELKEEAIKTANRINLHDKKLLSLEATKSLKDVLDREKKKAYKAAAEKGREALHRNVEGRHKTAERHAIKALKDKFIKMMDHPTDKQYIPASLVSAMVDVCSMIDTDTDLYKADGSINKAQQKRNEQMERLLKLRDEYAALGKNPDPMYSGEFDQDILEYLDELRQDYTGKSLAEMTLVELQELRHTLKAIDETLMDARKLIGWGEADNVYEAGDRIIDDQRAITEKRRGKGENTTTAMLIDNSLSPLRNIKRMADYKADSPLVKLFRDIELGVRNKNKFVMDAYKSFEPLTSGENAKKYEDAIFKPFGKEYIDKEGRKFRVSKMEMMQAIMSYNRELANNKLRHVSDGGFAFADIDLLNKGKLREAIDPKNAHTVNLGAMMAIEFQNALANDKWAQEYMKTAEQFFDVTAKDAVNKANMTLKHRIIATGSKYIPYEVDKDFVVREITSENDIQQTISGYGMLKDIKAGATQPLIITGLNNILERHIDQVGNIHGLAVPVRNFNKVWNVKSQDGSITVQKAIKRNFGERGAKVMVQAVKDVQGSRIKPEWERVYSAVKGNVIGATFMGNGSVVTKQVGSLFTATAKMKWRDPASMIGNLIYTMANYKKIAAEVDKYTATAWVRRQGMSDAELHTLTTEAKKKGIVRLVSKLPTALNPTKWITGMDSMVALSLWTYAKADVAKQTGLSGEELYKAAAEYYDDIVENTQSMSDALHRPEIQKSGGIISETLGTFKTDLYQGAGLMADALGEYKSNPTKENAGALARAITGNVMSAVWGALMTSAFALLRYKVNRYRDDEDDEIDAESWLKVQGSDLASDLVSYVVPLFGGELYDIISAVIKGKQVESFDNMVLEAANDLVGAFAGVANAIKDGEWPSGSATKKLINSIGSAFGVPVANMTRLWEAIRLHAEDIANGEFLSFEAGLTSPNSQRLYNAYVEDDDDKIKKASRLYEDEADIESALRQELRENDARIRDAAVAAINGKSSNRIALQKEIIAEGHFKQDIVIEATNAEANYVKGKLKEAKEYMAKGKAKEAEAIYNALLKRGYSKEFIEAQKNKK